MGQKYYGAKLVVGVYLVALTSYTYFQAELFEVRLNKRKQQTVHIDKLQYQPKQFSPQWNLNIGYLNSIKISLLGDSTAFRTFNALSTLLGKCKLTMSEQPGLGKKIDVTYFNVDNSSGFSFKNRQKEKDQAEINKPQGKIQRNATATIQNLNKRKSATKVEPIQFRDNKLTKKNNFGGSKIPLDESEMILSEPSEDEIPPSPSPRDEMFSKDFVFGGKKYGQKKSLKDRKILKPKSSSSKTKIHVDQKLKKIRDSLSELEESDDEIEEIMTAYKPSRKRSGSADDLSQVKNSIAQVTKMARTSLMEQRALFRAAAADNKYDLEKFKREVMKEMQNTDDGDFYPEFSKPTTKLLDSSTFDTQSPLFSQKDNQTQGLTEPFYDSDVSDNVPMKKSLFTKHKFTKPNHVDLFPTDKDFSDEDEITEELLQVDNTSNEADTDFGQDRSDDEVTDDTASIHPRDQMLAGHKNLKDDDDDISNDHEYPNQLSCPRIEKHYQEWLFNEYDF